MTVIQKQLYFHRNSTDASYKVHDIANICESVNLFQMVSPESKVWLSVRDSLIYRYTVDLVCFVNTIFLFLCLKSSLLYFGSSLGQQYTNNNKHKTTGKNDHVPMVFESLNGAYVSDYSKEFP